MIKPAFFSSSSLIDGYNRYVEKTIELCSSILTHLFFQLLFIIFLIQFGIVGGTFGAIGGVLIGFKNKMNLLQDIITGSVLGAVLSHKIIRAAFNHVLHADHADELSCLIHLIDIVAGDLGSKLVRDQDHIFVITKVASCEKLIKLPKIKISNHDASGNATCCSICLQDLEVGDAAGIFPKCEHKFHPECISQWLRNHNSCPICRRSI